MADVVEVVEKGNDVGEMRLDERKINENFIFYPSLP